MEAEYTGDWVCQTFMPGYNIRPPSADASQPLTNHMTTPSTVVVLKLALRTDGTYVTADGSGRYALDPAAKTITWLDGPYREALIKTQLGRRDNGAPTLGSSRTSATTGASSRNGRSGGGSALGSPRSVSAITAPLDTARAGRALSRRSGLCPTLHVVRGRGVMLTTLPAPYQGGMGDRPLP